MPKSWPTTCSSESISRPAGRGGCGNSASGIATARSIRSRISCPDFRKSLRFMSRVAKSSSNVRRLSFGQLEDQVVPQDAPRRPIAAGRLGLPPQRQLANDGHFARRKFVQLGKPVPGLADVLGRDFVHHVVEFGEGPVESAEPRQRVPLLLPDRQHVFDVFERVLDLRLREGPVVPVRARLFAVHAAVEHAIDERGVRQRITAAPQPLGHLHVDEFAGGLAARNAGKSGFRPGRRALMTVVSSSVINFHQAIRSFTSKGSTAAVRSAVANCSRQSCGW